MPQIQVLVLSGEVAEDDTRLVVEFAQSHGFTVSQHTTIGKAEVSLDEVLKPSKRATSKLAARGWQAVGDLHNESLGELLDLTWHYYAGPPEGIMRLFKLMAERFLAFNDANLDALRRNDLSTLELEARPAILLERSGIRSVELLRLCTPTGLLDLRNFGQSSLDEVRAKLASKELKLRGDS